MRTVLAGHKARLTESLVSSRVEKMESSSFNSEALWGKQVHDRPLLCTTLNGDLACTGEIIKEQERLCNQVLC